MRFNDSPEDREAKSQGIKRTRTAWTGLVLVVGGITLAIIRPEHAYLGAVTAMLGAGVIEPSHVLGLFRK